MTQKMIQDALTELKVASRIMGRAYLMSNSKNSKLLTPKKKKCGIPKKVTLYRRLWNLDTLWKRNNKNTPRLLSGGYYFTLLYIAQ